MTEIVRLENDQVHVTFPIEDVQLVISCGRYTNSISEGRWNDFIEAINNNLDYNIGDGYDSGYGFTYSNGKVTIWAYIEEWDFNMTSCILLSDLNRHILIQMGEAFRCHKNSLGYKWVDFSLPVKNARNI